MVLIEFKIFCCISIHGATFQNFNFFIKLVVYENILMFIHVFFIKFKPPSLNSTKL